MFDTYMKTPKSRYLVTCFNSAKPIPDRYFFRITTRNHRPIATSEGYRRPATRNRYAQELALKMGAELRDVGAVSLAAVKPPPPRRRSPKAGGSR